MSVPPESELKPGKKSRLCRAHLPFFPGTTLFDALARAVCAELFEAWETAKRVRRRFHGGTVVDFAAGHGLVAYAMLLLDRGSDAAICVDVARPPSFARLEQAISRAWPRLAGRVRYVEQRGGAAAVTLPDDAVLVCVHGCGTITDDVLTRAIAGGHRVAVLPCCHSRDRCDTGRLLGWLPVDVAVDATRAARLGAAGFQVWTQTIPAAITPQNRLLLAAPDEGAPRPRLEPPPAGSV